MNHFIKAAWKSRYLLILVFPFFYFFAGLYIKLILEDPSLRSIDPDYVYFISGLNISEGIIKVTHIDHPGTPLQYLIAAVIRIIYLFRKNPIIAEDVLGNSDVYLTVVNIIITLLIALTLFLAGKYVFKKTNSVLYAILIQTVPFLPYIWYEIIGRITPELLFPIPIIALSALMVGHIYTNKENFSSSQLVIMSLILGFGLSIKMTLLPLLILPLIIVRTWKAKLLVLTLTLFFFLLIALPVTLQIERFWNWIKNLFLYSGSYGSGEKNVVDWNLFSANLLKMVRLQKSFSYLFVLLLLTLSTAAIWFRKRLQTPLLKKLKITLGILLIVIAQTLMVAKHYSPHYFIPAVMFSPLLVFLFIEIVKEFNSTKILNIILMGLLVIYLSWNLKQQVTPIRYNSGAFQQQIEARKLTRSIAKTFEDESIKLIVTQDYGSPFVEYALHFSTVWSAASARERYREILAGLYPNTYQYTTWDGRFIQWGEPLDIQKITNQNIPVYLFLQKNSDQLYEQTIHKLKEVTGEKFSVQKKIIFENKLNHEALLQLNFSAS